MSENAGQDTRLFRALVWAAYLALNAYTLPLSAPGPARYVPLAAAAVVTLLAWNRRFSLKALSYAVFLCTVLSGMAAPAEDPFLAVIVALACAALLSVFQDGALVLLHGAAALVLILYFLFFRHPSTEWSVHGQNALGLFSCAVLTGVTLWLWDGIRRRQRVDRGLRADLDAGRAEERARDELLSSLALELRSAAAGLDRLSGPVEEGGGPAFRERCCRLQDSGRVLLSILNDIQDFSRSPSGVEAPFSTGALLSGAADLFRTQAGDKRLELIVRADPNLPRSLIGDEIRLRRVVMDLLTAAVERTVSGAVLLQLTQARRTYGVNLRVSVRSMGVTDGTAIPDLTVSRHLAARMGGFLSASGDQFLLTVPLKTADRTPLAAVRSPEDVVAAVCFDPANLSGPVVRALDGLLGELGSQLRIRLISYRSLDRLKAKLGRGGVTHCFVGCPEYQSDPAFFDGLARTLPVWVLLDRTDPAPSSPWVRRLSKPFSVVSLAAALNQPHAPESPAEPAAPAEPSRPGAASPEPSPEPREAPPAPSPAEPAEAPEEPAAPNGEAPPLRQTAAAALKGIIDLRLGVSYCGGREAYLEIFSLYLDQVPELMEKAEALYRREDWQGYAIEMHSLKSDSLSVGAEALSRRAKVLEQAGKAGDAALIRREHAPLLAACREVMALGRAFLAETASAAGKEEP